MGGWDYSAVLCSLYVWMSNSILSLIFEMLGFVIRGLLFLSLYFTIIMLKYFFSQLKFMNLSCYCEFICMIFGDFNMKSNVCLSSLLVLSFSCK